MYQGLWITQERERGFPKDIRFKNFKRVVVHSSPWLDFGLEYCLKLHLLTLKLLLENFQNLWNKIVLIYCERCTVVVIHKHSFGLVYVKDLSRTIVTTLPPLPMWTSTNNYNISQPAEKSFRTTRRPCIPHKKWFDIIQELMIRYCTK